MYHSEDSSEGAEDVLDATEYAIAIRAVIDVISIGGVIMEQDFLLKFLI